LDEKHTNITDPTESTIKLHKEPPKLFNISNGLHVFGKDSNEYQEYKINKILFQSFHTSSHHKLLN
jgi:hypothetical protein